MAHRRAPQADLDLDDIWYYIATKSGSADIADRLVDSITDRFFLMANHPYLGRARDEDLRPGLRSFPVAEYVIIYRTDGEDVVILRVTARQPEYRSSLRPLTRPLIAQGAY